MEEKHTTTKKINKQHFVLKHMNQSSYIVFVFFIFSFGGFKTFSLSMGSLFESQCCFPFINHTNYLSLIMSLVVFLYCEAGTLKRKITLSTESQIFIIFPPNLFTFVCLHLTDYDFYCHLCLLSLSKNSTQLSQQHHFLTHGSQAFVIFN